MRILDMNHRLILTTLFHAIFSSFGDIEANCLNFMNVPIKHFFNESIYNHYGYDLDENEFNIIFSAVASTMFVGIVVGGLSMGYLMDYYGRKATAVYIRSFLGILAAICMIGAKFLMSIELFIIGHFLAGIICSLKVVLFIYVAECAPDNRRGISTMTIGSGSALIMLAIQPLCLPSVFGNDSRWTGLPAICLSMAVVHFLVGALFPQSPKHLYITEHKKDEAVASIRFYHGSEVDIDLIEEEYEGEKAIMSQGHISLKQVWENPTLRWSLLICLVCGFVPASSAINIKSQYQVAMFLTFGMDQSQAMLAIMLLSFLTFPLCLIAPIIIEKAGRRPLFMTVSGLCVLEWVLLMIAQAIVDFKLDLSALSSSVGIVGALSGQLAIMLGLLNMTPIMISELCPHVARAPIGQFVQVVPIILSLIGVSTYPVTIANFGALYHLPYLFISAFLFYLLYQNLPETTGLPVDRIVRKLSISTRSRQASISALIHGTVTHHNYGALNNEDYSDVLLPRHPTI